MVWKKLQKIIDTINSYYAFAVLLYVGVLYISNHSRVFLFVAVGFTPLIAAWGGYLLHGYLDSRNQKHGFSLVSHNMTYEINGRNQYTLKVLSRVKAQASRMMAYPIGYQWSGSGQGALPILGNPRQKLMGTIEPKERLRGDMTFAPYKEAVSSEDDWSYWFVGFDHALYKGEEADIMYAQNFEDKKKQARPCLYYVVNTSLKKLEMHVKFADGRLPKSVTSSYSNLSDRRHAKPCEGVIFEPELQYASWTIENPKFGRCYRIDWQY